MKRRKFSSEFKKEAARILIIEGLAAKEGVAQFGVAENLLYCWKQGALDELEAAKPAGTNFDNASSFLGCAEFLQARFVELLRLVSAKPSELIPIA